MLLQLYLTQQFGDAVPGFTPIYLRKSIADVFANGKVGKEGKILEKQSEITEKIK